MRKLFVLLALGVVGIGLLAGSAAGSGSAGACGVLTPQNGTNRYGGIISAQAIAGSCAVSKTSNTANGLPPLIWWGGPVMGTSETTPITVTPIFWSPSGGSGANPMPTSYVNLITQYLNDVAAASGSNSNVFSVATEYYDHSGSINYNISVPGAEIDRHALPASGCTVAQIDRKNIYADGSGYNACLSDAQITAEIERLIRVEHWARNDYSHIYVMYTPKGVESCFNGGSSESNNACTINHLPTAAYCAYHSMLGNNWPAFGTVYANMPYPIYSSPVGYTCGSDAGNFLGGLQSPNNNLDADTEISPTSHEINEAITDPNVYNGWYDQVGYENGDECAYVWGSTAGPFGAEYNQTINGHNYLTQEEFSNIDFFDTGGGCVQSKSAEG